ncbi:hypothetical protein [Candidatus Nitrosotenuis sp. DW1]|uniref:hypothetical protein n=1 Tax=Candidatus Nitrosotenuis sp. DW1 TaxID=2259672 RepID=UPI0015CADE4C|nr:hypothetical protein [Candidatus Nitrosotenuis sp. DW1]
MSRTVSARIPKQTHEELLQRCNKAGCTVNEWLNASIDYLITGSSEFDFGVDEEDEVSEKEPVRVTDLPKTIQNTHENKEVPTVKIKRISYDDGKTWINMK